MLFFDSLCSIGNFLRIRNKPEKPLEKILDFSENEKFRLQSELQRIETERRLLEDERRKLMAEVARKSEENLKFKNALLEEQSKQMVEMSKERQSIAKGWSELESAKSSIFDLVKPEAFVKHEENIRQAACKLL